MININNMLTQLNAKMAADIADSYNVPELVKRVEAYQKLNVDAGTVPEYSSSNELPDLDSAIIGQIVYVKQKPESRGDYSNDIKDSAGTFFFGKKVDGTTIGWQKIPLLVGDSDYAEKYEKIIYSIIVGGALGNFYDRILYKAVPDFIDLHYNNYHWFIFNFADLFITFGIIGYLLKDFFYKGDNEKI